jgi:DNA-binding NarL/FixJ family response regulator
MEPIRIGLIDDQQLFRQSLAMLIRSIPGFDLVMEAGSGNELLEKLSGISVLPEIVLMDMEMPEMDGMELKAVLQQRYPRIKIIVLSVHANERLIARMIELGSSGYLVKNCDKDELVMAIQSVAKSGFYINAQVLKAIQSAGAKKKGPISNFQHIPIELSSREKEVLRLICREYSNQEIADKLYISVRTAEGHRNNLMAKTGCRNTAGLVLFAVRHNISDLFFSGGE